MNYDDSSTPLGNIVKRYGKSIASLLVEVGENPSPADKWLDFVGNLECLAIDENYVKDPRLIRRQINAFNEKDYVALSYTWNESDRESPEKGKYEVQSRDRPPKFFPSPVRDCIFDRVFSFMRAKGLRNLWIDRHCVRQWTCKTKDTCRHKNCIEKRHALQTMDLVYGQSEYPVSLLGSPIEWEHEIELLERILSGRFVKRLQEAQHDEVLHALSLLSRITKDYWWTRAWTFQEDYRGRPNMTLLIPHPSFLEERKQSFKMFSNVPNEICINSVCFSKASTELCLAVQDKSQHDDVLHHTKHILGVAGLYKKLLKPSMPLSPKVIVDIQRRRLREPWDKLAIIANCCQYDILIDSMRMRQSKSLSISILAMYILNGEFLRNEPREDRSSMLEKKLSQFLEEQAFDGFCSPDSQDDFTFNKGCRFVDVKITPIGIKTRGHLWKMGRIIDTSRFRLPVPGAKAEICSFAEDEHRHLARLVAELKLLNESTLAGHIERFLNYDRARPDADFDEDTFSRRYMRIMAKELVAAIEKGSLLRLARLWSSQRNDNRGSAVFIWDADISKDTGRQSNPYLCDNYNKRRKRPEFAFTASRPLKRGSQERGTNDLDHHVSLEVKWTSWANKSLDDHPQLFIKRWLVGLCFFYGFPTTDVVFPWPSCFHAVNH